MDQRRLAAIDQGGELVPRGDQPAVGSGGRVHQPAHQEPGSVQLGAALETAATAREYSGDVSGY